MKPKGLNHLQKVEARPLVYKQKFSPLKMMNITGDKGQPWECQTPPGIYCIDRITKTVLCEDPQKFEEPKLNSESYCESMVIS